MPRRIVRDFEPVAPKRPAKAAPVDPRVRAEELQAQGMPPQMALAVAHGRLQLSEALERMSRMDKVEGLIKRHDLSRALATQVALGHADLDKVLQRKRFDAQREANRTKSALDVAQQSGARSTVELHGKRRLTGTITAVAPYEITFESEAGSEVIHKLQIQALWNADQWKDVRKALKTDKRRSAEPKEPIVRPQDRYSCSDKRLFRCLDAKTAVVATLLEGLQVPGTIAWFSRFEIGIALKEGPEVVVLRHALDHLKEG
jgi:sRNA-binding regulator protein Hfq